MELSEQQLEEQRQLLQERRQLHDRIDVAMAEPTWARTHAKALEAVRSGDARALEGLLEPAEV
jgi:hypothetical protein